MSHCVRATTVSRLKTLEADYVSAAAHRAVCESRSCRADVVFTVVVETSSVLCTCLQAERARKNAEGALAEASTRVNELTIQITAISGDRRRFESDLAAARAEAEEAVRARREAEDRADRLQLEVNRLLEELRREQENYKSAESVRKQLEIEIREISVRLEEAESFAQREGKRLVAKLQSRVSCRRLLIRVLPRIAKTLLERGLTDTLTDRNTYLCCCR